MEKNKRNDKKPKQRFSKEKYGEFIRKNYATKETAVLAEATGLTVRQIKNYVYRNNLENWASKNAATLSRINSKKGKKCGRPRK